MRIYWKLLAAQMVLVVVVASAVRLGAAPNTKLDSSAVADVNEPPQGPFSAPLVVLVVGTVGAGATSWLLARRWSKRIAVAREVVAELASGENHRALVGLESRDELGQLARAIDQARAALFEQIEGIDRIRKDLQNMLETIPEAVIAIDDEQRVLFANPSTYRLFDISPESIAGKKLWQVLRQPGLQDAVTMTVAGGEQTNTEFEMRQPQRVISFRGQNLTVGSGRGVIMVLNDVTELRRLERLRQDFFASVSHELKTPLAAIKAYSETLLDDGLHDPGVVRRFIRRIEEQADRLHALVIDMLMLARVESEDHGFDIQPIDVRAIVLSSLESFRQEVAAKNLDLTVDAEEEVGSVMADAEGVGMIVRNLVDNAIKYTPGGGRVAVSVKRDVGGVSVRVQDTGVGIPPEDLSRIFERFYRVDKARSRELGGTGLGLSIVKHLVQQFGGKVSVRSRLQEGSTFTVVLTACEQMVGASIARIRDY